MRPFPWRVGMLSINGHRVLAVGADGLPSVWAVERYGAPRIIHYQPFMGDVWTRAKPDPKDGATKGAFLEAVREVYNDPHIGVSYETWIDGQNYWRVGLDYEHPCRRAELGTDPDSEFAALEAAWKEAP